MERTTGTRDESRRVTLKWAQTLDGRIATLAGSSRWISGDAARVEAHALRAEHSAILVGIGTVLADDPTLTVRHVAGRDPLRVVVDSRLRIPPDSRVLRGGSWVVATTVPPGDPRWAQFDGGEGTVLHVPGTNGSVDLEALFRWLRVHHYPSVLVEGGSRVLTECLHRRLAHEVAVFLSPKITGTGIDAVAELHAQTLTDAIRLLDVNLRSFGDDVLLRGKLAYPAEPGFHSYTRPS